jgi:hypothetical protein
MTPLPVRIALWANIAFTVLLLLAFAFTRDTYYGIGAMFSSQGLILFVIQQRLDEIELKLDRALRPAQTFAKGGWMPKSDYQPKGGHTG